MMAAAPDWRVYVYHNEQTRRYFATSLDKYYEGYMLRFYYFHGVSVHASHMRRTLAAIGWPISIASCDMKKISKDEKLKLGIDTLRIPFNYG
ncbi:MAG: hypothetical protein IPJ49_21805 [Candidatus Obscuribacter sp.]|nr:hypothetical protein [Candidatus Obscuribacter sp.]